MKKMSFTCIVIVLLSVMNGCATKPLTSPSFEPINVSNSGIDFSIYYLSEEQLIDLHGKDINIFTNFPGLLPRKKIVVFQVDIQTELEGINININDIILTIGNLSGISKTKKQLLKAWKFYLRENNDDRTAKKLANERMFPDSMSLTPRQKNTAWIVFLESYPDEGESRLTLSIDLENEEDLLLEIPLSFETDGENKSVIRQFLQK